MQKVTKGTTIAKEEQLFWEVKNKFCSAKTVANYNYEK